MTIMKLILLILLFAPLFCAAQTLVIENDSEVSDAEVVVDVYQGGKIIGTAYLKPGEKTVPIQLSLFVPFKIVPREVGDDTHWRKKEEIITPTDFVEYKNLTRYKKYFLPKA
jgi:hypothetical protein